MTLSLQQQQSVGKDYRLKFRVYTIIQGRKELQLYESDERKWKQTEKINGFRCLQFVLFSKKSTLMLVTKLLKNGFLVLTCIPSPVSPNWHHITAVAKAVSHRALPKSFQAQESLIRHNTMFKFQNHTSFQVLRLAYIHSTD